MQPLRQIWTMLRQAVSNFLDDNATTLAASLAYYTALSLAPMLVLVITLTGAIFGKDAASAEVSRQLTELLGKEEAEAVQKMIADSAPHKGGWVAGGIGAVTLVVAAIAVFGQLQSALNIIWKVTAKSSTGIWPLIKDRLLSFSMVAGLAFLLLVSMVLTAGLDAIHNVLQNRLPAAAAALKWANFVASALLPFLMFVMIFKVLPYVKLGWRDVWVGAALTTLLFAGGKYLIALYLAKVAPGSTFGAAGSFVVLLVWLYYSSLILFFGAEFTRVYVNRHGEGTAGDPEKGAEVAKPTGGAAPTVAAGAVGR